MRIGLVFTGWVQGEVEAVILKHGGCQSWLRRMLVRQVQM